MSEKIRVQINVKGRWSAGAVVEMTREQYDAMCAKLDAEPSGCDAERLAEECMDLARIDIRDGEIDLFDVEDFVEVKGGS